MRLHRQLAVSAGLLRSFGAFVFVALSFLTGCSGTTASHSLHIPAAVDSKAPAQRQRPVQVSYKVREHDGTIVQSWKRAPLSGVIGGGGSPGPTTAPSASPVPTSTPVATPTPVATGCDLSMLSYCAGPGAIPSAQECAAYDTIAYVNTRCLYAGQSAEAEYVFPEGDLTGGSVQMSVSEPPAGITWGWSPSSLSCSAAYPTSVYTISTSPDTPPGSYDDGGVQTRAGDSCGTYDTRFVWVIVPRPVLPVQTAILETPDNPQDAPPYTFEDAAVPAVIGDTMSTSSTARRSQATVPGAAKVPCSSGTATIDVRSPGVITITDKIVCPSGSVIDTAYAQAQTFSFNAQTTPIGTAGPKSFSCGGSTCTATITFATSGGTGIVGIEVWNTAHFPHEPPVKSPVAGFSVPFNDDGNAYPQQQDTRTSAARNVPFPEPPPVFQACAQTKSAPLISGCSYRRSIEGRTFRNDLRAWYAVQNWPQEVFRGGRAEAHHIQPLCWGGRNDYKKNGVFLERSVHDRFTAWWGAVKLGSQMTCENDE